MSLSRRSFVRQSSQLVAATTAAAIIPGTLHSKGFGTTSRYVDVTGAENAAELVESERINALVLRAVEAGRAAGASFVDARVTRIVQQAQANEIAWRDREQIQMGVRAFVNGVWGFASSPYCDLEEAVFLARAAVSQAKINSQVFPRDIELGSYPIAKGHWSTPIEIDPFTISMEERLAHLASFSGLAPRNVPGREYQISLGSVALSRTEKTIATSEGSLYSQTLYVTGGEFKFAGAGVLPSQSGQFQVHGKGVESASAGWEIFEAANLRQQIPGMVEEVERDLYTSIEPVTVGRYELVASPTVTAGLLQSTLANATQLDRVLGFEANAGGTSYLGPNPMRLLGSAIGASSLTVTADRSMPRGLGTTRWDDEGVEPEPFTLVDKGRLVDFQTTRETAGFLSEWYSKQNMPVRSHGCSYASDASVIPMLHTPNLSMAPGNGASSMEEMIANTERGIAFIGGSTGTDFQSISGVGGGYMREIRNGKLGSILFNAQLMFSSLELWKSLIEVGNKDSIAQQPTLPQVKGEPRQVSYFSIQTPPIRLKDMAIVDGNRKA